MKIVEVINELQRRGGAEVFLASLSVELHSNPACELYVISLFDDIDISFKQAFEKNGITYFTCNKKKGIDLSAAKKFKKLINEIKPDIIHFHLSCLPTYYLAFGCKKRKWLLFETFHSIPGANVGKVKTLLRKKYIKKNLLTFVGISNEISNMAKRLYPNIKCHTIYNGTDVNVSSLANITKKYDFIIVASLTEVKNHMLLFESLKDILSINSRVKLLCVGDGPLKEQYRDFVENNNLKNNIFFTGPVSSVRDYLFQSDCFVLSSVREGNPMSILEAMSCGLAIIAPRVGGIPDVVIDGANGYLYERGSKEQLAKLLDYALKNKTEMEKIGQYNINYVKKFSLENCANGYIKLFSDELERSNKNE